MGFQDLWAKTTSPFNASVQKSNDIEAPRIEIGRMSQVERPIKLSKSDKEIYCLSIKIDNNVWILQVNFEFKVGKHSS